MNPERMEKLIKIISELIDQVEYETREECARAVDHIMMEGGGTYGDFLRRPIKEFNQANDK